MARRSISAKGLPAGAGRQPAESSFDRWLDGQLAALYRDVLDEPLPDDLARLVARLERGRQPWDE